MPDIPVVFHFKVELALGSANQDIRFQEVSGLSAEVSTEEYQEGGLNQYTHRLPTGTKYSNLILKRGYLQGSRVTAWCRQAVERFVFEPTDATVTLLNDQHEPLAGWSFSGAYPVKWSVSDLKAQESALVVESLELAYRCFRKV